ncbi:phosphatidylglycerophosphate synthase, partial [Paraburkholderia caledonica]|nr:phosphatidylglycerophosphate synthase [Paraburkholderia caledonica]
MTTAICLLGCFTAAVNAETPPLWVGFLMLLGSLTITYFHTGNPHYHRRGVVSRS